MLYTGIGLTKKSGERLAAPLYFIYVNFINVLTTFLYTLFSKVTKTFYLSRMDRYFHHDYLWTIIISSALTR